MPADVTGDGMLDICAGDLHGNILCVHMTGEDAWDAVVVGAITAPLSFGDVDGDGMPDLLTEGWWHVSILFNAGNGSFKNNSFNSTVSQSPGNSFSRANSRPSNAMPSTIARSSFR